MDALGLAVASAAVVTVVGAAVVEAGTAAVGATAVAAGLELVQDEVLVVAAGAAAVLESGTTVSVHPDRAISNIARAANTVRAWRVMSQSPPDRRCNYSTVLLP